MTGPASSTEPFDTKQPIVDVRNLLVRRAGRAILGPLDLTIRAGQIVACGAIGDVLTADVLSQAFDVPIVVASHDGRAWARMVR